MLYKWEVPAMTAVIYARSSSDNQREESIEGQIRECTAYAEKNGITIVKHYIDRAISAKTDNRPEFQQMIKDSDKKLFDIVLVWKLDRFARNRYDSARYKTQLKKNGVKLMSATEIISGGPEGIILESVLEGYAQYYSADLAEKVVRGQTENILKGRCNGGRGTFGYTLDSERKFHIDPLTSPFVLEAFRKYRDGLTMKEIRDWLKEFRDFAWSDSSSLTLHQSARIERTEKGFQICIYNRTDYDALLAGLEKQGLSLPTADEWSYLCGGGCRTLFPWGDGLDYSMRLRWFEDMDEDENRPYDMEEPNFFGLSIAYDPYMREVVQADRLTTCGVDDAALFQQLPVDLASVALRHRTTPFI